jgi:glycosyltransferase involved in cell wall biosynthesis
MREIIFIADGFHKPYVDGESTVLKGWLSLLDEYNIDKKVLTFINYDKFYNYLNLCIERAITAPDVSLITYSSSYASLGMAMEFLKHTFYSTGTNPLIRKFYLTTYRIREYLLYQELKSHHVKDVNSSDIIHLHNISTWLAIKMRKILRHNHIILSYMSSDINNIIMPRLCMRIDSIDRIAITSLKGYALAHRFQKLRSKVVLVPPYVTYSPSKDSVKENSSLLQLIKTLKEEGKLVVLYIGDLNSWRFPLDIFVELVKLIDVYNLALVIISSPKVSNLLYSKKLLDCIKVMAPEERRSIVLATLELSSYEKESLFKLADIFIFPSIKPVAIDPPISIIEALMNDLYVVSSDFQSIPEIIRLSGLGKSVEVDSEFKLKFISDVKGATKECQHKFRAKQEFKALFSKDFIKSKLEQLYHF